jgi:methanogenic corrinoid protein MtbC1
MSGSENLDHLDNFPSLEALRPRLVAGLLSVDRLAVKDILTQSYRDHRPFQLVEELIVPALEQIGNGWEKGVYSLSQVYMAGQVCEQVVDLMMPASSEVRQSQPKMAIAVLEDYHLLGKVKPVHNLDRLWRTIPCSFDHLIVRVRNCEK